MRGLAYAIAALAAVGIMIAIASYPPADESSPVAADATSATGEATSVSTDVDLKSESGTLTVSVPKMHCAVACYPRVKETLEKSGAVTEVELGPQKEEGLIDNRQVVVRYEPGFNVAAALRSLEKEGFADSAVVQ